LLKPIQGLRRNSALDLWNGRKASSVSEARSNSPVTVLTC